MKNKLNILVMFFILTCSFSCQRELSPEVHHSYEAFNSFALNEFIYASSVSEVLNPGEIILRPPGVALLITSFVVLKIDSIKSTRLCLYYKVPFKDKLGELSVIESENLDACLKINSDERSLAKLQGVSDFHSELRGLHYEMAFKHQGEERNISLPLINLEHGLVHEKYRAQKTKSLYSGLKIIKINPDHFENKNNFFLGNLSDSFESNSAIRCLQINKECKTIGEDLCERCRYGSYEVVDYNCPQGGSRFCGQNRCGQKNEPACPIGAESKTAELAGICQGSLSLVLNADRVWVCQ